MKSSKSFLAAIAFLLACALQANAAHVDFNDPRRALGREDDIRIDAQLLQETVSSGSPLNVTWQVENLTGNAIAVADKVADVSYDADASTIELSIGSEIPTGDVMPHLTVIAPGQKKVFSSAAVVRVVAAGGRGPLASFPRFVTIKVNVLRDVSPFATLVQEQAQARLGAAPVKLPDALFDRWVESNDAIFLNPLPVAWSGETKTTAAEARRPMGTF